MVNFKTNFVQTLSPEALKSTKVIVNGEVHDDPTNNIFQIYNLPILHKAGFKALALELPNANYQKLMTMADDIKKDTALRRNMLLTNALNSGQFSLADLCQLASISTAQKLKMDIIAIDLPLRPTSLDKNPAQLLKYSILDSLKNTAQKLEETYGVNQNEAGALAKSYMFDDNTYKSIFQHLDTPLEAQTVFEAMQPEFLNLREKFNLFFKTSESTFCSDERENHWVDRINYHFKTKKTNLFLGCGQSHTLAYPEKTTHIVDKLNKANIPTQQIITSTPYSIARSYYEPTPDVKGQIQAVMPLELMDTLLQDPLSAQKASLFYQGCLETANHAIATDFSVNSAEIITRKKDGTPQIWLPYDLEDPDQRPTSINWLLNKFN